MRKLYEVAVVVFDPIYSSPTMLRVLLREQVARRGSCGRRNIDNRLGEW